MARCELKVWGYIGPGGEKCGGIWPFFAHIPPQFELLPIYPRKIRVIDRRKRRQELVILIFRGPCALNDPCAPNGPGNQTDSGFQTTRASEQNWHQPTPSIISGRLNHGRGFGKGADRLIISLGIKGHMKRKIPYAQVGPT